MIPSSRRSAFSLIELLVVIAIIALLAALLMSAVQKARTARDKVYCVNNLKQMGIGLYSYHAMKGSFPPGSNGNRSPYMLSWFGFLLPYVERDNVWKQSVAAYQVESWPYVPPHPGNLVIPVYTCPQDKRVLQAEYVRGGLTLSLTSYQGVDGTNFRAHDGIFFANSSTRLMDITDGASNTVMAGERPPSADMWLGWWYSGAGQLEVTNFGSTDVLLGVNEINNGSWGYSCPTGPYAYKQGDLKNNCDMFHFWSLHPNGANWLFADGSVHFIPYAAANLLPALSTTAGGEKVGFDF